MERGIKPADRPCVKVFYRGISPETEAFREVLYGIEEEGIPFEIAEAEGSAAELAYKACRGSRLGVGIGIAENTGVLHYEKLRPESPLFVTELTAAAGRSRALGANAARLVKQMPFKEL